MLAFFCSPFPRESGKKKQPPDPSRPLHPGVRRPRRHQLEESRGLRRRLPGEDRQGEDELARLPGRDPSDRNLAAPPGRTIRILSSFLVSLSFSFTAELPKGRVRDERRGEGHEGHHGGRRRARGTREGGGGGGERRSEAEALKRSERAREKTVLLCDSSKTSRFAAALSLSLSLSSLVCGSELCSLSLFSQEGGRGGNSH